MGFYIVVVRVMDPVASQAFKYSSVLVNIKYEKTEKPVLTTLQ